MKRVLTLIMTAVLTFGGVQAQAKAEEATVAENVAVQLKTLGLFRGTDKGFELDREMTRAEAITMLVRALGAEKEALECEHPHGFTDVPAWANGYVAYANKYMLTNGISETEFGSDKTVTAREYLAFILRALGYTDAWREDVFIRAADCEMLPQDVHLKDFQRRDAVLLTAAALFATRRETSGIEAYEDPDTDRRLFRKLIESGTFTEENFVTAFPADPFSEYRQAVSLVKNAVMERENTGKLEGNVFRDDLCFLNRYSVVDGILEAEAAVTIFENVSAEGGSTSSDKTAGYRMEIEMESGTVRLWEEAPEIIEEIEAIRDGASMPYAEEAVGILGYDMMLHNRMKPRATIADYKPEIVEEAGAETYEESMAMLENKQGTSGISEQWEGTECTACLTGISTPHGGMAALYLVFKADSALGAGKILRLPLPEENMWAKTNRPDTVTFSEDGKILTYTRSFAEKAAIGSGTRLIHEKGTYVYTVDTETGELEFTLEPLAE